MKKTLLPIIAVSALALSSAAQAAESYVGFGVGATNLDGDCAGTTSCDKSDTGFKLFGGYKFSPNMAGEVVYMDFGKAKVSTNEFGGTAKAEIKTSGFGAGLAFNGQFSPEWSGVARVGIARVKSKVSVTLGGRSASDSESSTQPYFGLGVSYAAAKDITVDIGADFTKTKFGGESFNVRMIGVGMSFGF